MNKELIKKYKAEFEHWLNGGKLLGRYNFTNISDYKPEPWFELQDSKWLSKNQEYLEIIINDEYVEFRKALAEGKTLQLNDGDKFVKNWGDVYPNKTPLETYPVHCYRIKPEEPKFKVGDWVRAPSGDIYQINETNILHGTEHFTPWQPKEGEWCWFWNFNDMPTLEQFSKYHDLDDHLGKYETLTIKLYQYCEPFIGQLPSFLKDSDES